MLKIAMEQNSEGEVYDSLRLVLRATRDAADIPRRLVVLLCVRQVEVVNDPLRNRSGPAISQLRQRTKGREN